MFSYTPPIKLGLRLLALLLPLFAMSCATSGRELSRSELPQPAAAVHDLPALPVDLPSLDQLDQLRGTSEPLTTVKNGSEFFLKSAGAVADGLELDIVSGAGELQWAIYSFEPGDSVPLSLGAEITLNNGTNYFLLADYAAGRWAYSENGGGAIITEPLSLGFQLSPAGRIYCAILCWNSQASSVIEVSLTSDSESSLPGMIIDAPGDTGYDTSMVNIAQRPAIAYCDFGLAQLRYVRATDVGGTAWGAPITVVDDGSEGRFPSMLGVNGRPAIAYFEPNNETLRYVRANDSDGATWADPITVDDSDICGEFASMAIVNGFPAVSYQSYGAGTLRYVRALDIDGATWGEAVDVDEIGFLETSREGTSMLVANGNPAIAYYSYDADALLYVSATDNVGGGWGEPITVDSNDGAGRYPSMNYIDGKPAIMHVRGDSGHLYLHRATDLAGSSWDSGLAIDDTGNNCAMTSFSIIGGKPAAAYYDFVDEALIYVDCTDSTGNNWNSPRSIDNSGNVGVHPSLLELPLAGGPAISYCDFGEGNLLYQAGF